MQNQKIRITVFLGAISILGILFIQFYFLKSAFDIEEKKFSQTAHIALLEVMKKLLMDKNLEMPNQNPVMQVSSDFYVVNVNNEINDEVLELYLISELSKYNILTEFEYGIYDCETDQMVYGNYVDPKMEKSGATPNLSWSYQPDMVYHFSIRFPDKQGMIFSNLKIYGFFLLVTIIAILFFVYAIFIILNQKRLSEVQRDFINNITHELKTPIASIKIASDYLKGNLLPSDENRAFKYAGLINEQNERLNKLVDNVLLTSKTESKSPELNLKVVDLKEHIVKLIPLYKMKLGKKDNIDIHAPDDQYLIRADELHLTNILNNLADNAIKYGKEAIKIDFRIKQKGSYIYLSISDNGIGIDKPYLDKVFKKFYRVPTGNVHTTKGFGLGLYYVRNVCNQHGWKIAVESEFGMGTVINIIMRRYED